MNWLAIVRGLRGGAWGVGAALAIYGVNFMEGRIAKLQMSAPQAASFAAVTIAELIALYVVVRAVDTVLELRERRLLEAVGDAFRGLQRRGSDSTQPSAGRAE